MKKPSIILRNGALIGALIVAAFAVSIQLGQTADDIIGINSRNMLVDSGSKRWQAELAYTTNGNGDVVTLGGLTASDDVIGDALSGNNQVVANDGRRWDARVLYTTDGSGNVIPIAPPMSVSATAPLVDTAGVFSIPVSTNSVDGYLSAADHTTFAAKQAQINLTPGSVMFTGATGDVTQDNAGFFYDDSTNRLFMGQASSMAGSNAGIQFSNSTTANRGQIKLHSYYAGASIAGVSTLTSASGTIGVNTAIANSQDYSKWTAQASPSNGAAPIVGTWAFKSAASGISGNQVPSDFHISTMNQAGVLGDKFYLTSEGVLTTGPTQNIILGSTDAFGRVQIQNKELNATLKLGSWGADGDPTTSNSEGIIVNGVSLLGTPIVAGTGGYARVKADRFGLFTIEPSLPAYAGGQYYFRADATAMYYRDNAGAKTFEVTRDTGVLSSSSVILGGASSSTNAVLTFKNGHLRSTQTTAPTAVVNANAGTGATCTLLNATDSAGVVNLTTTATAPASGVQCTVTFNKAHNVAPICVWSPADANSILFSVANGARIVGASTTTMTVEYANADAIGHANAWAYHCVETQ